MGCHASNRRLAIGAPNLPRAHLESWHCAAGALRTRARLPGANLQQQRRKLAVPDGCGWLGANDAQRGPLRHFAGKGSGSNPIDGDLRHRQLMLLGQMPPDGVRTGAQPLLF